MTRIASIMGVAAVATLVLLSGCEAAMEKTDYAKQLAGTWKLELMREGVGNLPGTTTTAVTAMIARTETNKGTLAIEVTDTPPAGLPATETAVSGNMAVTSSKITVTDLVIKVEANGIDITDSAIPADQRALLDGDQELTWKVTGDKLKVSSPLLPILLKDPMITELEFTKE